jgi:hypothetical protein
LPTIPHIWRINVRPTAFLSADVGPGISTVSGKASRVPLPAVAQAIETERRPTAVAWRPSTSRSLERRPSALTTLAGCRPSAGPTERRALFWSQIAARQNLSLDVCSTQLDVWST